MCCLNILRDFVYGIEGGVKEEGVPIQNQSKHLGRLPETRKQIIFRSLGKCRSTLLTLFWKKKIQYSIIDCQGRALQLLDFS